VSDIIHSFKNVLNKYSLIKVSRVNWLRAKARYERWEEELKIVKNEMQWTKLWFIAQEKRWEERVIWARESKLEGHECYAKKQVCFWEKMRNRCEDAWGICN
jgi:hypothetical protein